MFKFFLIFAAAMAVSHGNTPPSNPRNSFPSTYTLFTNVDPKTGRAITLTVASITPLPIVGTTPCAIIVHDIGEGGSGMMSTTVRDALLTSGTVNVIVLDWLSGSNEPTDAIDVVSRDAVELIRLLSTYNKVNAARLHLIGFGIGAHVAGQISRSSLLNIARVTGLNPRIFTGPTLRRLDAPYVEVIHTEITELGIRNNMGEVDFYPNLGEAQPGCDETDLTCSHNRAWELFAASLTHGRIRGKRCSSVATALAEEDTCTAFTLALGTNDMVKYGTGIYRLETSEDYPFRCLESCELNDSILDALKNFGN